MSQEKSISTKTVFPEYRVVRPDGTIRWVTSRAYPIRNDRGEIYRIAGTTEDITERKKVESSLRAIEWLMKKSPTDNKNEICLPEYGDITALNTERTILDSIGKDVLSDIVKGYMELLETSAAVYERNGDYAHGNITSGYCQMLDNASRKLCNTNDNASALSSKKWLCHESCWTCSSKITIQTGQPTDIECHGGIRIYAVPIHANGQVIGSINYGYGDPPRDMKRINQIAKKYNLDPHDLLIKARAYESRPRFIIELAKNKLEVSARLIGSLVESKKAQVQLQKERELLNVTLQSIVDSVISTDVDGNVILINKVAEFLTGFAQKEAVGRTIEDIFHIVNEHSQKRYENPVKKALETDNIVKLSKDIILLAKNGRKRLIEGSVAPIVDFNNKKIGAVLVFRDITEKERLDLKLRNTHKMDAIGKLIGGIAHEFNNILSIIIGNVELANIDIEEKHLINKYLDGIYKGSIRARDVVKQLLTFKSETNARFKQTDIRVVVKESMKLLRAIIPSNIKIQEILPFDIDYLFADSSQINQLLFNLGDNASQAMGNKDGTLTIKLDNVILHNETSFKFMNIAPGRYISLMVSDTGCGMSKDLQERIFDPYFSTKDLGDRLGMGLAVVYGIVKSHNGAIDIESNVGKGTTFKIYFPSNRKKVTSEEINQKSEIEIVPTGNERILLVDDEPLIVKSCERILSHLGYFVTSSTDPLQILKWFKTEPDNYDLLFSDITMPNMMGDQLSIEVLKIRPDFPIIICTGYSEKISPDKAKQIGIKGLLMKPLGQSELAKTIRKVLDETTNRM